MRHKMGGVFRCRSACLREKWALLVVGLAIGLGACTSPEAIRTRGSGSGADVGNRAAVVEMHAGAQPYYQTPCRIAPDCPGVKTQ